MELVATYLGWLASILVIASYGLSIRRKNPLVFHWGNVIGAIVLVPVQIYLGVAFAALLSGCFGILAAAALYKYWREPAVSVVTPNGVTTFTNTRQKVHFIEKGGKQPPNPPAPPQAVAHPPRPPRIVW